MRKIIPILSFLIILGFAVPVFAADVSGHDDATFDADVSLYLPDAALYLTVSSGAEVEFIDVGGSQLNIGLLEGSSITITSPDMKLLDNALVNTTCGSSTSYITIESTDTVGFDTTYALTVTPNGYCPGVSGPGGGGGGGGGGSSSSTTDDDEEDTTDDEEDTGDGEEDTTTDDEEETTDDTPIGEMTATQLQAKVTELLALINQLKAQLVLLKGGLTITDIPSTFSFTYNMMLGDVGGAVKYLQIVLNSDVDTQVAGSGVGSPGNETNYFGSLTEAAVIKFQDKYAPTVLNPLGLTHGTGFVGSSTRAKLNTLIGK